MRLHFEFHLNHICPRALSSPPGATLDRPPESQCKPALCRVALGLPGVVSQLPHLTEELSLRSGLRSATG